MTGRRDRKQETAELDRQTHELLGPWFAERTASPPPASIMQGVQQRVPATRRRAGWRITDWWLWRSGGDSQRAGFVLATATSVLVLTLAGMTSAGVFILGSADDPGTLTHMAGAGESPEATAESAVSETSPQVVDSPEVVATPVPAPIDIELDGVTAVGGTVVEPKTVDEGTLGMSASGATETMGITTEARVELDDPRLTGIQEVVRNERSFGDGKASVSTGAMRITNEGGSWSGTFESVTSPGRPGELRAVTLSGDGEFEGLAALLLYDLAKAWGDPSMVSGVISPWPLPAAPDRSEWKELSSFADIIERPPMRAPEPRDGDDLPLAVTGDLVTSVGLAWWAPRPELSELPPEYRTGPTWMAGDLIVGDPRLDLRGYELMIDAHADEFPGGDAVFSGRSRGWSDDGGAWQGTVRGFTGPDAPDEDLAAHTYITTLTGTDAYGGLSAVLFTEPAYVDPEGLEDTWSVEGMLFAGGLPDYPAVP